MTDALKFSTELKLWKYEIERLAKKFGLSFHAVMYIIVTPQEMSELVARGGFPTMPHHWRHGQESLWQKKQFRYGMGRIYEMVINTRPYYAYLLRLNDIVTQKAVMAHVCGHADMDSNNLYFRPTNKNMVNVMAMDALRVERFCELHGRERVKEFYDWALSFEWYVDMHSLYMKREDAAKSEEERDLKRGKGLIPKRIEPREPLAGYMDEFLNPAEWLESERARLEVELFDEIEVERGAVVPAEPTRDLLSFLMRYAPLEQWQREFIAMIRRQTYYFLPQMATHLMHEGWATYWQEEIMTEAGLIASSELRQFANELAGVQRQGRGLNPYKLGYDLWHDIRFRWDTGRHGMIWEDCTERAVKDRWDEFAVWKTIADELGYGTAAATERWEEFSAFVSELKAGNLAFPQEIFIRNLQTAKYLVPTWIRYTKLDENWDKFSQMREEMEPFELQARLLAGDLHTENPEVSLEEHQYKARRDIYEGALKSELWLWTLPEVKRELASLEAMRKFRERFRRGEIAAQPLVVESEWEAHAKKYEPLMLGRGIEKMFDVRSTHNDYTFLDEFFTREFCEANQFFFYKARKNWDYLHQEDEERYVLSSRDFQKIKRRLLFRYTNFHMPVIRVVDANYDNNGELYLRHEHTGVDMDYWSKDEMYMKDVLARLFWLWGGKKTVHLETIIADETEEAPWWDRWSPKEAGEEQEEEETILTGTHVIFSYGFKILTRQQGNSVQEFESDEEEFEMTPLEPVKFPAPF